MKFDPGDKVTYVTDFEKERGIVKSLCEDHNFVFVVYHCDGKWENYQNYTAARTPINCLHIGWID